MKLQFSDWEDGLYRVRREIDYALPDLDRADGDLIMGRTDDARERIRRTVLLLDDIKQALIRVERLASEVIGEVQE